MNKFELIAALFVLFGLLACDDDEQSKVNSEVVSVNCKAATKADTLFEDSLVWKIQDNRLNIALYNATMPCDLTKVEYEVTRSDNKVVLTIVELDGDAANCVCPMDFSYAVDNLSSGETYHCDIIDSGRGSNPVTLYSFDFSFHEGEEGVINSGN